MHPIGINTQFCFMKKESDVRSSNLLSCKRLKHHVESVEFQAASSQIDARVLARALARGVVNAVDISTGTISAEALREAIKSARISVNSNISSQTIPSCKISAHTINQDICSNPLLETVRITQQGAISANSINSNLLTEATQKNVDLAHSINSGSAASKFQLDSRARFSIAPLSESQVTPTGQITSSEHNTNARQIHNIQQENSNLAHNTQSSRAIEPSKHISTVNKLGFLVRNARESMGMNQQRFADLCGVGRRFISELENGKNTLELGKVIEVCSAAGIDLYAMYR